MLSAQKRTVNFLSKETIAAIREAEARAERIKADAVSKGAKMVAGERAAGEKLLAETEAATRAEIEENFKKLGEATDRLLEKNRVEADAEADELKRAAQLRSRAAINEIFRGLDRQCQ